MLFNSLQFFIFFPLVTIGYFLLPHKWRWLWLLGASCYFYMVLIPVYILILAYTIVIDYFAGIWIEKTQDQRKKKWLLILSIFANLSVLAFFKYYNFLNDNLTEMLGIMDVKNPVINLNIILPVGLSFHTFQAMSYTIEVYRGHQKSEKHFGIYALYVMFYPQLVAGPIERPQNILHQFYEKHQVEWTRIVEGLKQMLWGLAKKVLIADRLAYVVDTIYNDPSAFGGPDYWIASIFFAFQIYYDFSGYSDIALGSAKVMGFKLMMNFNRPYAAQSISEFWKRWHISLSTWFRDYVYISIGGNRMGMIRNYFNLMFVFLLSGLWHGAKWTFVMWGFLHGLFLVFAIIKNKYLQRREFVPESSVNLRYFFNVAQVFILSCFAWLFFRANTTGEALQIAEKMVTDWRSWTEGQFVILRSIPPVEILSCFALIALIILLEYMFVNKRWHEKFLKLSMPVRLSLSMGVLLVVVANLFYSHYTRSSSFIYFQF